MPVYDFVLFFILDINRQLDSQTQTDGQMNRQKDKTGRKIDRQTKKTDIDDVNDDYGGDNDRDSVIRQANLYIQRRPPIATSFITDIWL